MLHNSDTPNIEVDPETYEVRVDGKLINLSTRERSSTRPTPFPILIPALL